jgi:AAA-like domain/TIR domain
VRQVFLSYRHVPPDEQLATGLHAHLVEKGLRVFLDTQIEIGLDWVAEIDRQLRASDAFVVFLSANSILSDMVRREIQIAYELWRAGKMRIFPIRVDFEGELPYDLSSYLNRIQYKPWRTSESEVDLFALLYAAITGGAPLPETPSADDPATVSSTDPAVAAESRGAPLPAADPRIVVMETGTIRLDSPFYVQRKEDKIIERSLAGPSNTITLWGPRQSGKSSLLARAHALSQKMGFRSVFLDLQKDFDESQVSSLGATLRGIAQKIARNLRTTVQPADVWDSQFLGEKGSFEEFLQSAVFTDETLSFVLIIDQIDRLFNRTYSGDFFSAIRGWHNNRATNKAWENLHLLIGHATDPGLWIENLNESPFNVGDRLRLGDFSHEQVEQLNIHHGKPLHNKDEIDRLIGLVGGHPYLIRQALYVLAIGHMPLQQLLADATNDNGPFADHLRRYLWELLNEGAALRSEVLRIARGNGCADEKHFRQLVASGLVIGASRSKAQLRCTLYQRYFLQHL